MKSMTRVPDGCALGALGVDGVGGAWSRRRSNQRDDAGFHTRTTMTTATASPAKPDTRWMSAAAAPRSASASCCAEDDREHQARAVRGPRELVGEAHRLDQPEEQEDTPPTTRAEVAIFVGRRSRRPAHEVRRPRRAAGRPRARSSTATAAVSEHDDGDAEQSAGDRWRAHRGRRPHGRERRAGCREDSEPITTTCHDPLPFGPGGSLRHVGGPCRSSGSHPAGSSVGDRRGLCAHGRATVAVAAGPIGRMRPFGCGGWPGFRSHGRSPSPGGPLMSRTRVGLALSAPRSCSPAVGVAGLPAHLGRPGPGRLVGQRCELHPDRVTHVRTTRG